MENKVDMRRWMKNEKKNIILVTFFLFVKLLKALRAKYHPKER